jgi:hypothetical protein
MSFQNQKTFSDESLTWQTIVTKGQKERLLGVIWLLLEQLRTHPRVKEILPQKGPIYSLGVRESGEFEVCGAALYDDVFEDLLLRDRKFSIEKKTILTCFGFEAADKERQVNPSKEEILKIVERAKFNPGYIADFLRKLDA